MIFSLYGVILNLALAYYRTYTDDALWMKLWVGAEILTCEIAPLTFVLILGRCCYVSFSNFNRALQSLDFQ